MAFDDKELEVIKSKAEEYLKWETSPVFRKEVEDSLSSGDWDDLY